MASLRTDEGAVHVLRERHLVGRSRALHLVIRHPDVSAEHAVIAWGGATWTLRDLGSRNGTWLNGERLAPGQAAPLAVGDRIDVGRAAAFTVHSLTAPAASAVCGDEVIEGLGSWLHLPEGDSVVPVVADDDLGWVLLRDGEPTPVRTGSMVALDGRDWRLDLPELLHPTREQRAAWDALALRFRVSADEEHVEVTVVVAGIERELKPRAHHYPLLTLARLRLRDIEQGVPAAAQGWIDAEHLHSMLRMSRHHVNVALYRCRKELAALDVPDAHDLIEFRAVSRTLRLGVSRLSVESVG